MSEPKTKTKKNGASFRDSMPSVLALEIRQLTKKQKQAKRSYLKKKLEAFGYRVNVKDRYIDLRQQSLNEIPVGPRFYVRQLLRMGFTFQLPLFS
jgi:hypothetical protein